MGPFYNICVIKKKKYIYIYIYIYKINNIMQQIYIFITYLYEINKKNILSRELDFRLIYILFIIKQTSSLLCLIIKL